MAPSAPWYDLPPELLSSIARRLTDIVDYVHFRSVCKPWRSGVGLTSLPPMLPWLMLPSNPKSASRRFFNLAARTVHNLHLPEAVDHTICGAVNQYIIMLNRSTLQVILLNPFNRHRITSLPPRRPFRKLYGQRIERLSPGWISHVLHSYAWNITPIMEEIVVAFTINKLTCSSFVYCRLGNKKWTEVNSRLSLIQSIAYHKEKFYVVGEDRSSPIVGEKGIAVFDACKDDGGSVICYKLLRLKCPSTLIGCCLIESDQDLLLVAYEMDVRRFEIFKLHDVDQEVPMWVKLMRGVGDGCQLFFIPSRPSSVVATRVDGAEGNCIYFSYGYDTVNVLHVKEYRIESLQCPETPLFGANLMKSTWLTPSLC